MLLMFVLLFVVAFCEAGFFYYLKAQSEALSRRQLASYALQAQTETAWREAEASLADAKILYNDATTARLRSSGAVPEALSS